MRGPQVLFAISDTQPELKRDQLARLQLAKAANSDWTLQVERSKVLLRPFPSIGDEVYQTYWRVVS